MLELQEKSVSQDVNSLEKKMSLREKVRIARCKEKGRM